MKYISKYELPRSPASRLKGSSECWCGAYKNRSDFEDLLGVHPDIFDKLIAVENAQKGKFTFLFENGVRIPLMSLRTKKRTKPDFAYIIGVLSLLEYNLLKTS